SWVEKGIGQIRKEVDENVSQSDNQNATLHQVVIAIGNRLNGKSPDTGPGEDGLGYDSASQHGSKLKSHHGKHRDHRIPQGVAVNYCALRKAFGPGGANVVLREFLTHVTPQHAGPN